MDYSKTLNLPETDFPMRGNLPKKEPDILAFWEDIDIYQKTLDANQEGMPFILHDGPPYANGDIHLGHALNKVLKDIIVKYKTMQGFWSPYIPGWDTHGLPIEQRAIKDLGLNRKEVSIPDFREKCKGYALKYVGIQKEEFRRLGVRGDWDHAYLTLNPEFEAVQIGVFGEMAQKGYIYKGLKPVYWCPSCETALAEAEVEYGDHKSPSIYVKFPVQDGKGLLPEDAYVIIWTTTPWTLPANVAVCMHRDFTYLLLEVKGEKWLVGQPLLENFLKDTGIGEYKITGQFKGADLEYITCQHPLFADCASLGILGDHVTDEAGTGIVHTAPGHGVDDFNVGRQYHLPVVSPLDNMGKFTEEGRQFAGLSTDEANKAVVKELEEKGLLIKLIFIQHQYPHCWRCKSPILFRATEQWFASIDGFRQRALEEIDKVRWIPSWGRERIFNMIRDRGDWCISRQRTWGVPIPIFYCDSCNKEIINQETVSHLQEIFRTQGGSQAWFAKDAKELLPEGFVCPHCGHHHFRKETDIMDVWFDSGSSFASVIEANPDINADIDLYLEGSDQHRGWFNSSLSISVATRDKAPYKAVLTHGFLVDERGHKQSKSQGNTVDPLKIIKNMGADVLRLWVASTDYRNDMANSESIMKQISEAYRKIRNTVRFLMGNLADFDSENDRVLYGEMRELDRYALHMLENLKEKVLRAYDDYEFHVAFHSLHKFCVVDMSAFYLDIIKDRLYVLDKEDAGRKAAQTVLYDIVQALVRLLAPILTFTTEEIWSYLRKEGEPESVQLLAMPDMNWGHMDAALAEKWERLIAIRDEGTKVLEEARQEKIIGHSLNAKVTITAAKEAYDILKTLEDELADLFIVSQVTLEPGDKTGFAVAAAAGEKCERCWNYRESVGEDQDHPTLCSRCAAIVAGLDLAEVENEG